MLIAQRGQLGHILAKNPIGQLHDTSVGCVLFEYSQGLLRGSVNLTSLNTAAVAATQVFRTSPFTGFH